MCRGPSLSDLLQQQQTTPKRNFLIQAGLDILRSCSAEEFRTLRSSEGCSAHATASQGSSSSKLADLLLMPEIALEVGKTAGLLPTANLCCASRQHSQVRKAVMSSLLKDVDRYVDFYVCGAGTTVERMQGAVEGRKWEQLCPRPTLKDEFAVTTYKGKIYVIGGMASGGNSDCVFDTMEEYDLAEGTWREMPRMHKARFGCTATAFGGKIFVIGGQSSSCKALNTVECFDLASGTWQELSPLNNARTSCAVVHINGDLYVAGGGGLPAKSEDGTSTSSVALSSVERYDQKSGSWVEVTAMPTPREACAAAVLNGKLCVLGGRSASGETLAVVESYDPLTEQWEVLPPMPVPRRSFLVAVAAGSLFVIGGNFGTSAPTRVKDATQRWNMETGEWKVLASPVCHNTLQGGGLFLQ
eukprot:CAMPEP_0178467882 /NCGR_PEP_ID=MMETSP0689_2-20121128/52638_1 /TAXON_ID=160604 /ORGANISM="Amphidinium massartii, Strain CS-259" /LENGTH=413 /DNA_ID=CAMNT_0020094931 /DNA_START=18 /DNA_END=1259 /DNA_ORIENTATION=+